jgi:hypothetical protein
MGNEGIQRYTDEFVGLANKLRWGLDNDVTIYQYKLGLPVWMMESLTAAEAAAIMTGREPPGVNALNQMALRIEVNHREKRVNPETKKTYKLGRRRLQSKQVGRKEVIISKRDIPFKQCKYCGKPGHTEETCRLKMKEDEVKKRRKEETMGGVKEEKTIKKLRCYVCGKDDYMSRDCSEAVKKEIKNIEHSNSW